MKKSLAFIFLFLFLCLFSRGQVSISLNPLYTPTSMIDVDGDGRIATNMGIGGGYGSANNVLVLYPSATYRNGVVMAYPGSGTISSTSYGMDMSVTSNQNVRGFRYSNSTAGNGTFYGVGSEITGGAIVSGYSSYRNGSGLSYGLYGINGTNAAYGTNANSWALFSQGRAVISSESSPTSVVGMDLEIRNTSAGANAVTLSMRQTTSNTISGNVLSNINFGDNNSTSGQAQIRVIRGAASGGVGDLPTDILFFNTQDGTAVMVERFRFSNSGALGIGGANYGTSGQVLTSSGVGSSPTWSSPYGGNIQSVVGTTDATIASATFADLPQMTITFTPRHSTVYVSFGMNVICSSGLSQQWVSVQIVVGGVAQKASFQTLTDYDDFWGNAIGGHVVFVNYPISVTAGASTTVKIQWRTGGVGASTLQNLIGTSPTIFHRNLTILD